MDQLNHEAMRAYYRRLSGMPGHAGRCAMALPPDLAGRRVLDVCCRKGKGAYELSDYTGQEGFVLGVDPDSDNVARARARAAQNHWAGSRWASYLRFSQAWPEDLSAAGVSDRFYDVVYINSAINLCWNLGLALAEFRRVLASGGRLWVADGIFSAGESMRASAPSEDEIGNVFARARSLEAFGGACLAAGFKSVSCGAVVSVTPEASDVCERTCAREFVCASVCAIV